MTHFRPRSWNWRQFYILVTQKMKQTKNPAEVCCKELLLKPESRKVATTLHFDRFLTSRSPKSYDSYTFWRPRNIMSRQFDTLVAQTTRWKQKKLSAPIRSKGWSPNNRRMTTVPHFDRMLTSWTPKVTTVTQFGNLEHEIWWQFYILVAQMMGRR